MVWQEITREQRVALLQETWKPTHSAGTLATALSERTGSAVTRFSVTGLYNKVPELRTSHPLGGRRLDALHLETRAELYRQQNPDKAASKLKPKVKREPRPKREPKELRSPKSKGWPSSGRKTRRDRLARLRIQAVSPQEGEAYKAKPNWPKLTPEAQAYDEASRHIQLFELEANECHWPVNDPSIGQSHRFCGWSTLSGHRYCTHHEERSTVPR